MIALLIVAIKTQQTKTVLTAFHFNIWEAKCELNIMVEVAYPIIPHLPIVELPCLDPSLSRPKLGKMCSNPTHHYPSSCSLHCQVLCTGMVSQCSHISDCPINDAISIVTGCLKPTPTKHLSVFSGIRILSLHLVLCGKMVTVIFIYEPQSDRSEKDKDSFHDDTSAEMRSKQGNGIIRGFWWA